MPSTRQAVTAPLNIQQLLEARQMGLGDYIAQAEMRNHVPSLRERLGNLIYDAAQGAGLKQSAHGMRTNAQAAMDFVPGLGDVVGAEEVGRDLAAGNYGRAAVGGLGTAAGVLPIGDIAGGVAKAIFGGIAAKTADKPALELAEKMLKKGASKDEIWNATGWFKGKDGKWRFEIDDSQTRLTPKAADELMASGGGTYGATQRSAPGVLVHSDLYEAYPELRRVDVDARHNVDLQNPHGSYYTRKEGHGDRPQIEVQSNSLEGAPRSVRGIMLHELQHGVQVSEGFARGAHPSEYASGAMFHKTARDLQGDLSKELTGSLSTPPHEIAQFVKYGDPDRLNAIAGKHGFSSVDEALEFLKQQDEMRTPFSQYKRTAGEVEARNVQKRMNMTAAERRATPPWLTEDVPSIHQILRMQGE